eukprot:GHVT01012109.1.p1 GENE.GHVT01012109.1~~GHVT01012109.1.p1  ORF type:complete len:247 (-),score=67.02 GHVT01012109.1:1048-1749(-)
MRGEADDVLGDGTQQPSELDELEAAAGLGLADGEDAEGLENDSLASRIKKQKEKVEAMMKHKSDFKKTVLDVQGLVKRTDHYDAGTTKFKDKVRTSTGDFSFDKISKAPPPPPPAKKGRFQDIMKKSKKILEKLSFDRGVDEGDTQMVPMTLEQRHALLNALLLTQGNRHTLAQKILIDDSLMANVEYVDQLQIRMDTEEAGFVENDIQSIVKKLEDLYYDDDGSIKEAEDDE